MRVSRHTPYGHCGRRFSTHGTGVTLVELLASIIMAAMLVSGLNVIANGLLQSRDYVVARAELNRQGQFALSRVKRIVSSSEKLLLPLADVSTTNWPEHVRDQTMPASPPIGDSTLSTAVLAVSLPAFFDLDFDGVPDADNDADGRIDEDVGADRNNDAASGLYLIDDNGDGSVDDQPIADDDEHQNANEDPVNSLDDDGDNNIDEDPGDDMDNDGCPGRCTIDDDGDGQVDEGSADDDDEDGQTSEDWYDPVVFYLDDDRLLERIPVPWDENGISGVTGRDFIINEIANNVSRLRIERMALGNARVQLIEITLELTDPGGESVSLTTRVRVSSAL